MAALSITAASVLASAQATRRREYTFGYAGATAGQQVYLDTTSNTWQLADTDNNLGCGLNDLRGTTLNAGGIGQPADVCVEDPDFTPGTTMTNGKAIYLFTTAGTISEADIPTTGAKPVICGIAKSTTKMVLKYVASGAVI